MRLTDRYTTKTVKFPIFIMCWGAIRADGKRILIRCHGNVDSTEYIRVLKEALPEIYNSRFVMQQGGATCHTSRLTTEYFTKNVGLHRVPIET